MELDLSLVPEMLRGNAARHFADGNAGRMLCTMENTACLGFVCDNLRCLQARGIYEAALVHAYNVTRTNFRGWSLAVLEGLFRMGDRARLRAASNPIPPGDRFTLYRGLSGRGRTRRVGGMSWTGSLDVAKWFAMRFCVLELADPAVYETTARADDVYCYVSERNEHEFIYRARRWRRLDVDLTTVSQKFPSARTDSTGVQVSHGSLSEKAVAKEPGRNADALHVADLAL